MGEAVRQDLTDASGPPASRVPWPAHVIRTGWRAADLDPARITITLTPDERAAVTAATDRVGDRDVLDLTADDFRAPQIDDLMQRVAREVKQGSGLVFLRGLPIEGRDADDARRMFWGLSAHLGLALSQSGRGDRLGDVRARADTADGRGYTSDAELQFHCDLAEMFGLLCIQDAREGGETLFASMLAAREALERTRPEVLPILERGFRLDHNPSSLQYETEPFTAEPIPLFSVASGLRSCWLTSPERASRAAADLGIELDAEEQGALTALMEVLQGEGFALRARLRPGEAAFVNNYELVHARSRFAAHPDRPRHLLRIWLQSDPPRPMAPEMALYRNPSGLQGLDPKPDAPAAP